MQSTQSTQSSEQPKRRVRQPAKPKSPPATRGGAREGSGQKAGSKASDYAELAKARAKHEKYKAELQQLKYNEAVGTMVKADDARDAMSTLLKSTMLTLDTLSEVMEREAKLSPEQAGAMQRIIDRERRSLHAALMAASGGGS